MAYGSLSLAARLLAAHVEPAAPAVTWTSWTLTPELLVVVAIAGTLYARGLRRWPERSRPHPRWRIASFYGALGLITLINTSPLHAAAERQFFLHMIQHEILMMIGIPLLLLGAPTTPMLRGMPRGIRRALVTPLVRSSVARMGYRLLTHPVTAFLVFNGVLIGWHMMPGWYDATLTSEPIHDLQHITFALAATVFWWNVIDVVPMRGRLGPIGRIVFLIVASTPKDVVAAFISFADHPVYTAYEHITPAVHISSMTDQELGGLIMWVPGQTLMLLAAAAVFFTWVARNEREENAHELGGPAPSAHTL